MKIARSVRVRASSRWLSAKSVVVPMAVMLALAHFPEAAGQAPTPQAPACSETQAPALGFDGLPARAVIGRDYMFSVVSASNATAEPVLPAHVTMYGRDSGETFFSDELQSLDRELFIRQDLGDEPSVVAVDYLEQAPDGSRCARRLSGTVGTLTRIYVPNRCFDGAQRPRGVTLTCGDGGIRLRRLHWRSFNRSTARARGLVSINDCEPYCAVGRFVDYRVTVTADRPRRCAAAGQYLYTRVTYRFRGARPSGTDPSSRFTFRACWLGPS
jgi:hypothetical protein